MLRLSPDTKQYYIDRQLCHTRLNTLLDKHTHSRYTPLLAYLQSVSLNKSQVQERKGKDEHKSVILPSIHKNQFKQTMKTQGEDRSASKLIMRQPRFKYSQIKTKLNTMGQLRFQQLINPQLSQNVIKLAKIGIRFKQVLRTVCYSGHIKIPTVHNDYHNAKTNAGYSRNKFGGIYPK